MTLHCSEPRSATQIFLARSLSRCSRARARQKPPADRVRVSGQVEATDVQVAAPGRRPPARAARRRRRPRQGRRPHRAARHGRRRARARARAGRARSGRRAAAPAAGRRARRGHPPGRGAGRHRARPTSRAAEAELAAAQADVERFEALLAVQLRLAQAARRCGDAARRGEGARAGRARSRARRAAKSSRRLRAGARREEIDAGARPRRRRRRADRHAGRRRSPTPPSPRRSPASSPRSSPTPASCSSRARRSSSITDLDHAWANVYVDEPVVPRLRLGQPATVFTDAGGAGLPGTVSYISDEGRVHAAQRADGRGPLEAGLPRQGLGRQHAAACSRRACRSKRRSRSPTRRSEPWPMPSRSIASTKRYGADDGRARAVAVGRARARCSA